MQGLHETLELLPDGAYVLDREGIVRFINQTACDSLGYTKDELTGKNLNSIVHALQPGGDWLPVEQCQIHRPPSSDREVLRSVPTTFCKADGQYIDVLVSVRTYETESDGIYTISTFQLIFNGMNERIQKFRENWENQSTDAPRYPRELEKELTSSQLMLEQIMQNINAGIAVYEPDEDCHEFYIVDINRAGEIYSGVKKEDIVGKRVTQVFPGVERLGLLDVFRRVCREGLPEYLPMRRYTDDNLDEWVTNYVYRISDGKIVAIYQDVTAEKYTQIELEKINKTLERRIESEIQKSRSQEKMLAHGIRLSAMGEMLNNIAHHWRQPLSALSMIIQDLEDARRFDELDAEYTKTIVEQSTRLIKELSETIDRFQDFFRSRDEQQDYNIANQIYKTVKLIQKQFQAERIDTYLRFNNKLVEDFSPEQLRDPDFCMNTHGNPVELSNVIVNILNNSRDAIIHRQKEVEQREGSAGLPGMSGMSGMPGTDQGWFVRVDVQCLEDEFRIDIEDNGGGIDSQLAERVFEPYVSTKVSAHGSGLGLYLAKMIVQKQMNGQITFFTAHDGTRFTIRIPA